ncbi:MAG TPA: hydrogenase 3 maturation endopeptidase HyCI [Sedimentisphaerales bacterium]|nr:hydrogenase 3 maturation endopeptidase HyCI [Sedimentisphaerales bacterium]
MGAEEQLFEQLSKLRGSKTLIVGIGNLLKGDDAAGPLICRSLKDSGISADLIDAGTVPENYIQTIIRKNPRTLLIIDAIDFGQAPGTVGIFKPEQLSSIVFSTHSLSPRLFVDVIEQAIEVDVYFMGIQPANTRLGQSLSPRVRQAVRRISKALIEVFSA